MQGEAKSRMSHNRILDKWYTAYVDHRCDDCVKCHHRSCTSCNTTPVPFD